MPICNNSDCIFLSKLLKIQISSNKDVQEEWNKRLNILNNNIKNYIDNIPDKNIEFIKLFYNEC